MSTETTTRNISIHGRRWFQPTYGNTYHSVAVYVDGESIGRVNFAYGYGDQYMQTAMELLVKAGIYKSLDDLGHNTLPWIAARDAGDKLAYSVSDVRRKKDLAF